MADFAQIKIDTMNDIANAIIEKGGAMVQCTQERQLMELDNQLLQAHNSLRKLRLLH